LDGGQQFLLKGGGLWAKSFPGAHPYLIALTIPKGSQEYKFQKTAPEAELLDGTPNGGRGRAE
jgi:hypothetical protein